MRHWLTPIAILIAALIIAYRPQPIDTAWAQRTGAGGVVPPVGPIAINLDGTIDLPYGRWKLIRLDVVGTGGGAGGVVPPETKQ